MKHLTITLLTLLMSMGVWAHEHEQFVEDSLKMIKDDISGKEINFSFQYAMFNTISTGLCATDFSHDCTEKNDYDLF